MKTKHRDPSLTLPLRLPADDVAFLDEFAAAVCNTRAGVIRLAISQMRKALEADQASDPASHSDAEPMAMAS